VLSRAELEKMDDPFLIVTATGIMAELAGRVAANRYRNSQPPRHRVIQFILDNQPQAPSVP
jgi:hypothetical protein